MGSFARRSGRKFDCFVYCNQIQGQNNGKAFGTSFRKYRNFTETHCLVTVILSPLSSKTNSWICLKEIYILLYGFVLIMPTGLILLFIASELLIKTRTTFLASCCNSFRIRAINNGYSLSCTDSLFNNMR